MSVTTVLGLISLIEAEVPNAIALYQDFKSSGKTVDQYVADIVARDGAVTAAATTEIAADQK